MRQRRIDGARLKRLCAKNRGSRALFQHFGQLHNTRGNSTSVEEMLAGLLAEQKTVISRRELVRLLHAFARAGCGWFRVGRRGKPSRFEWATPAHTIAATVLGEIPAAPARARQTATTNTSNGADPTGAGTQLTHSYHLRRGMTVSISLPTDLTEREATRLADFIRTLSFGPAAA
jgi:hypothetical protein